MFNISWVIAWLPSWFWSILLLLGIAAVIGSQLLRFIPVVNIYKLPLEIVGIVALITSIWFLGAASNEEKWKLKIN